MKAEHRKELQTNSLADFLGRTVLSARSGGGVPWVKIIVVFVIAVVLAIGWLIWRNTGRSNAEAWAKIEFNDDKSLSELAKEPYGDTKQGQAARFTIGFDYLWGGVRAVGAGNLQQGVEWLHAVRGHFEKLADECKDEPERAAEAKYHVAVATEALAVLDVKLLAEAKSNFEALASGDLGSTAFGMMAKKRLELYNNRAEFDRIERFYKEFKAGSKFKG